ncbi:competence protein CoiA [Planococcus sp. 1R117A]|uniref:competence protein CoiA n=1 Tax=Planococcus sp. 1R117A TaxID=3447020 RepID=UPI003EDBC501
MVFYLFPQLFMSCSDAADQLYPRLQNDFCSVSYGGLNNLNILLIKPRIFPTINKRRVNAILVAKASDGRLFYLNPLISRQELLVLRGKEQFFCPSCSEQLLLKVGNIKIPHFAHRSLSECSSFSEPESPMHLHGKYMLHQFFSQKNHHTELEKYLPEIKQRADLLIDHNLAIEFQCSPIPVQQIELRSAGYKSLGIMPLWLFSVKNPLHEGIQIIKFKSFEQAMLQRNKNNRFVIAFNPANNRFYYYSSLFYSSGNRWIAKVKSLPAEKQTFPFAIAKRLTKAEFFNIYLLAFEEKQRFVRNQQFAKNRFRNPFWRLSYELQLDANALPLTLGIPLIGNHLIEMPAVLWQMQALQAAGKGITMKELLNSNRIKMSDEAIFKDALELLEQYLKIDSCMKKQEDSEEVLLELLYDSYCKSV